jgi:hypothetical protein
MDKPELADEQSHGKRLTVTLRNPLPATHGDDDQALFQTIFVIFRR